MPVQSEISPSFLPNLFDMKKRFRTIAMVLVVALFLSGAMILAQGLSQHQASPQGVTQTLTPEQRQQVQQNLSALRGEIQTLSPEARIARVTQYLDEIPSLTPAQRQGLRTLILQQSNEPPPREPATVLRSEVQPPQQSLPADPNNPFNHSLTALIDFGTETYKGRQAGLYPDGSNIRPAEHHAAGVRIAQAIKPLDTAGNVDEDNGKIVWLSIGMSNTGQATNAFFELLQGHSGLNPKLEMVNGTFAQGIDQINNPRGGYWNNIIEQRLRPLGLTPEQVQIVWFKQAESGPTNIDFEEYTTELAGKFASVMRILKEKYPNLKLVYLTPRTYAGYAKTRLNPEPFAWYTGWAIKFVVEDQIKGAPGLRFTGDNPPVAWLSWGPYFWANGENPNSRGLFFLESDFSQDGTHPSSSGTRKVAWEMYRFFATDETTVPWFLR